MNNFIANYIKILETLQQIESKMNFLNQKRKPKLSDIEYFEIVVPEKASKAEKEFIKLRGGSCLSN